MSEFTLFYFQDLFQEIFELFHDHRSIICFQITSNNKSVKYFSFFSQIKKLWIIFHDFPYSKVFQVLKMISQNYTTFQAQKHCNEIKRFFRPVEQTFEIYEFPGLKNYRVIKRFHNILRLENYILKISVFAGYFICYFSGITNLNWLV